MSAMKQNLYYQAMRKRENPIKQFILNLFSAFSSYPRLLLEVFIRKDFGERYFNWGSAVVATFIFAVIPYIFSGMVAMIRRRMETGAEFLSHYGLWYLYLAAVLFMSYKRWREIKRKPGVFDFARFSLSHGRINPFFFNLPFLGKRPSVRMVEILFEPGLFFLAGILLWLFGQGAGFMLVLCSISYCFSYWADYKAGDDFIMDIIDQRILNEDMEKDFFESDPHPYDQRGSEPRFRRPTSKADWHTIIDAIIVDDEDNETMAS